ncbi:MAG: 3-deoxy-7-phosphoheptulonate synthase [Eubacteriales bacterium]|nr:3-deoxy-7-phosphoheptulonate synthase [Eubacteriales bacterium]
MIIKLKNSATAEQKQQLISLGEQLGVSVCTVVGAIDTLLGFIGDTTHIDIEQLEALDIVDSVKRIQAPYKKANRIIHPENTTIKVGDAVIGGSSPVLIAGPCSVESEEQICSIALDVKNSGAQLLRGGAFKPRTSPYAFQGLRKDGIKLLLEAKQVSGLPIVTEIMDISQLPLFDDVDVIQVGARNMQNFELLKELGKTKKPILLKRGLSSTLEELLMSAEYIMSGGNEQVILCERGIRTFETATRNTLDLSAIPVLKNLSHLPIIIDPSHATGKANLVPSMARAAIAAGADGLIIEVHNNPPCALCDGQQSLTPEAFDTLAKSLNRIAAAL